MENIESEIEESEDDENKAGAEEEKSKSPD